MLVNRFLPRREFQHLMGLQEGLVLAREDLYLNHKVNLMVKLMAIVKVRLVAMGRQIIGGEVKAQVLVVLVLLHKDQVLQWVLGRL